MYWQRMLELCVATHAESLIHLSARGSKTCILLKLFGKGVMGGFDIWRSMSVAGKDVRDCEVCRWQAGYHLGFMAQA